LGTPRRKLQIFVEMEPLRDASAALLLPNASGLHSSTFQLNVSTFGLMCWDIFAGFSDTNGSS